MVPSRSARRGVAEGGMRGVFLVDDGTAASVMVEDNEMSALFALAVRFFCTDPPGETGDLRGF